MSEMQRGDAAEREALRELRSAVAVRKRCHALLDLALRDELRHFAVDLDSGSGAFERAVDLVIDTIYANYPDLDIPLHSRWTHFGSDVMVQLANNLADRSAIERAYALTELVIVSVFVDAGAGANWQFFASEGQAQRTWTRSEGLARAAWSWIARGGLSVQGEPLRVDAEALARVDDEAFRAAFQIRADNPLVGVEGRISVLRRLGETRLAKSRSLAGSRLGHFLDAIIGQASGQDIRASAILDRVLDEMSEIWPHRIVLAGANLGDVWPHPAVAGEGASKGLLPLHKLSQWLSYSLVYPLQVAGYRVIDLDALTGLAEYRNGGLFVDTSVLRLRDPAAATRAWTPGDELIVEWRGLTVALLDRLADRVRQRLGCDHVSLPLGKVLQGGTWAAGRELARKLRGGEPPILVASDGTVF